MEEKKITHYKNSYPDGLDNDFWRLFVSPEVIRIKGNKCEGCGSNKNLDVHHEDYNDEVSINTLRVLCRKCHKKEHKEKEGKE